MNRIMRRPAVLLALALLAAPGAAAACPTCRDSAPPGDTTAARTAPTAGFNNGIYLTLGAFFGVLGFVGYGIVKGVRGHGRVEPQRR